MSKIALKSSSSGTATFTIESPATNTDRTLVLPDVAGTIVSKSGSFIAPAELGSGTADNTTFLRGDSTFQTIASPTIASTGEAQAGTNNTNFLTPLRLREGFNATGSAPVFACRAFVNFNGTGTVAIRASGNVSSITDNATGNYTVNFTTAMPDADYGFNVTSGWDGPAASNETTAGPINTGGLTISSFRFFVTTGGGGARDVTFVSVQITR